MTVVALFHEHAPAARPREEARIDTGAVRALQPELAARSVFRMLLIDQRCDLRNTPPARSPAAQMRLRGAD
jgi:hypothetical protein